MAGVRTTPRSFLDVLRSQLDCTDIQLVGTFRTVEGLFELLASVVHLPSAAITGHRVLGPNRILAARAVCIY